MRATITELDVFGRETATVTDNNADAFDGSLPLFESMATAAKALAGVQQMSEVVQFPGAQLPAAGYSEEHIGKLHSQAFRDLEGRISDCESMAQIAAQLMCNHASDEGKLVFAVCNTGRMLKALMADY
ncbi:hypothetical protein [Bradyrhizobium sp. WSM1253]|uniref:hypothetical protein n=1 Tax=Bradyrhizobium sp. WSM1253 TaxID=319003 RepID=UPI00025D146A|nr:hypothetical protein [Bradyrhizobium sp. WSM1253]EIG55829.1 hypothetical protein Bra1253DRAFT_00429 [Bradyrhizobium sp. WSM1253]